MKTRTFGTILTVLINQHSKQGSNVVSVRAADVTGNELVSMPVGCNCLGIEDSSHSCNQFDCDCACDLTASICDRDCCCDLDCHDEVLSTFKCQNSKSLLPTCSEIKSGRSKEISSTTNPTVMDHYFTDVMENILCVQRDNSAVKGSFFEPDRHLSIGDKDTKAFDFSRIQIIATSGPNEIPNGNYISKDYLQSVRREGSSELRNIDVLNLPSSSDGGFCNEFNAVEFGVNSDTACSMTIENLEIDCKRRLSIDRYTVALSVLKTKTSSSSLNYESMKDSFVEIVPVNVVSSNGTVMESPSTIWDEEKKSCNQAVQSLVYNISISSDGSINGIEASISVVDIPEDTNMIRQEFSTIFTSVTTLRKSGNPGYILGASTLAGKMNDNGKEVEFSLDGLTVSDIGKRGGDCLATSKSHVIRFGEDSTVGCTLAMTREELETMCTAQMHPYLKTPQNAMAGLLVPNWLVQDIDMVGIFGNADPADITQWLPISKSITNENYKVKSRIWNPTHNICNGIITGLKYRILWSYAGSVTRPQAKIIRIQEEFEDNVPMTHIIDPERAQLYSFTTTVSWVFIGSETEIVKLPPPELFFSVPDDIFYPFQFI